MVTFLDGDAVMGTVAVAADGTASFTTRITAPGAHAITAAYGGDNQFKSSSQTLSEQVSTPALIATSTSLVAAPHLARRRHPVVFTATVTNDSGAATPTGTVAFMHGNVVMARVTLDGSGTARSTARFSSRGKMTIQALYSGDSNFAGSSKSLIERVI
jgi:hypothetical protein